MRLPAEERRDEQLGLQTHDAGLRRPCQGVYFSAALRRPTLHCFYVVPGTQLLLVESAPV